MCCVSTIELNIDSLLWTLPSTAQDWSQSIPHMSAGDIESALTYLPAYVGNPIIASKTQITNKLNYTVIGLHLFLICVANFVFPSSSPQWPHPAWPACRAPAPPPCHPPTPWMGPALAPAPCPRARRAARCPLAPPKPWRCLVEGEADDREWESEWEWEREKGRMKYDDNVGTRWAAYLLLKTTPIIPHKRQERRWKPTHFAPHTKSSCSHPPRPAEKLD